MLSTGPLQKCPRANDWVLSEPWLICTAWLATDPVMAAWGWALTDVVSSALTGATSAIAQRQIAYL